MTRERLDEFFTLRRELSVSEEILNSLKVKAAAPGAQRLTGMPHNSRVSDPVADYVAQVDYLEREIVGMQEAIRQETPEIISFVAGIRNMKTRMIFRLRLLQGLSWKEVSAVFGWGSTPNSVSVAYYRYLDKAGIR